MTGFDILYYKSLSRNQYSIKGKYLYGYFVINEVEGEKEYEIVLAFK